MDPLMLSDTLRLRFAEGGRHDIVTDAGVVVGTSICVPTPTEPIPQPWWSRGWGAPPDQRLTVFTPDDEMVFDVHERRDERRMYTYTVRDRDRRIVGVYAGPWLVVDSEKVAELTTYDWGIGRYRLRYRILTPDRKVMLAAVRYRLRDSFEYGVRPEITFHPEIDAHMRMLVIAAAFALCRASIRGGGT